MEKNQAINYVNTSESVKQELKTFTQIRKNLKEQRQKLLASPKLVIDYGQKDIYDYLVIDNKEQREKRKNTIKIRYLSTDDSIFELTDKNGKKKLFKLNENNKYKEYDPKKDRQNQQKQPELP